MDLKRIRTQLRTNNDSRADFLSPKFAKNPRGLLTVASKHRDIQATVRVADNDRRFLDTVSVYPGFFVAVVLFSYRVYGFSTLINLMTMW